jgi:hypothetical protein
MLIFCLYAYIIFYQILTAFNKLKIMIMYHYFLYFSNWQVFSIQNQSCMTVDHNWFSKNDKIIYATVYLVLTITKFHRTVYSVLTITKFHRTVYSVLTITKVHRTVYLVLTITKVHRTFYIVLTITKFHRTVYLVLTITKVHRTVYLVLTITKFQRTVYLFYFFFFSTAKYINTE